MFRGVVSGSRRRCRNEGAISWHRYCGSIRERRHLPNLGIETHLWAFTVRCDPLPLRWIDGTDHPHVADAAAYYGEIADSIRMIVLRERFRWCYLEEVKKGVKGCDRRSPDYKRITYLDEDGIILPRRLIPKSNPVLRKHFESIKI
jgi:hypothetical protein